MFDADGGLAWYRLGLWQVAASEPDQVLLARVTSDGPEIATSATVPADGFVPACTEIEPSSPTAPPATADSLATFGPIGTTPLLSLALPDDRSEMESRFADLESSNVRTTIVRGRRAIAVAKGPLCVYGLTTDQSRSGNR